MAKNTKVEPAPSASGVTDEAGNRAPLRPGLPQGVSGYVESLIDFAIRIEAELRDETG